MNIVNAVIAREGPQAELAQTEAVASQVGILMEEIRLVKATTNVSESQDAG